MIPYQRTTQRFCSCSPGATTLALRSSRAKMTHPELMTLLNVATASLGAETQWTHRVYHRVASVGMGFKHAQMRAASESTAQVSKDPSMISCRTEMADFNWFYGFPVFSRTRKHMKTRIETQQTKNDCFWYWDSCSALKFLSQGVYALGKVGALLVAFGGNISRFPTEKFGIANDPSIKIHRNP